MADQAAIIEDSQATIDALTVANNVLRTRVADLEAWSQSIVDLAAKAPLVAALENKAKSKDAEAQSLRDQAAAIDAAIKGK